MTTLSFHKKGFLVLSKIYIHVSVFIGQSSSFLIYYISFEINSISELRIEPTVQRYNRNHKTKCEFWIENDRWNSNIRIERSFGRMDIRRATVCGKCVKCPFIRKTYTRVVHICNSLNSAHIFSVIVNIHAIHDIYITRVVVYLLAHFTTRSTLRRKYIFITWYTLYLQSHPFNFSFIFSSHLSQFQRSYLVRFIRDIYFTHVLRKTLFDDLFLFFMIAPFFGYFIFLVSSRQSVWTWYDVDDDDGGSLYVCDIILVVGSALKR